MKKPDSKKKSPKKTFYHDLAEFTAAWLTRKNKEGVKTHLSEIVGGLEIVKTEIYHTQAWFVGKAVNKELKKQFSHLLAKLDGKNITIHSDGSIVLLDGNDNDREAAQ